VVERNRTKARSADCGFAEPEPPYGGEAVTVCYAPFFSLHTFFLITHIQIKYPKAFLWIFDLFWPSNINCNIWQFLAKDKINRSLEILTQCRMVIVSYTPSYIIKGNSVFK